MFVANISTKELSEQLENPEFDVLDVRPSAAYNGWKLQGEVRGGHIPGAINIPISWIKDLSIPDLKSLFSSKGIAVNKPIVIYGYQAPGCSLVSDILWEYGCRKIFIYEPGLGEWAADSNLPMDCLVKYEQLVYAGWVDALISNGRPMNFPDRRYKLFEVSNGGFQEYKTGHIPGAFHLDLSAIEGAPSWNKCSDDELLAFLLTQGVTYDSTVVLYGKDTMAAARAACILMYTGVDDVRILDGGFDAWMNAGKTIETKLQQPLPVEEFGKSIPGHLEYMIGIEEVKSLLTDDHGILVSVQSWKEYIGDTSGYDFIKRKGRIPGAVWGHSGSNPYQLEDYHNIDSTMRSYHEIASNWVEAGIHPGKRVVFYCGTGWRASQAFIYAYLMGWPNIAVYDGGWHEWSLDDINPVETGLPF